MLEIAEQDLLRSMQQDNPWWDGPVATAFEGFAKTRAYLPLFKELAFNWAVRRSVILMGPRRVGKTVMLKQLIDQALAAGFPAQGIFFASVDTPLYSGVPLDRLISLFERQTGHDPKARRLIIFDEIQYLKDWESHLKVLTDRHPNTRFIASGSAAAALRLKSNESGAGRFTDFFLPPLTFAEFLDFRDLESELISPLPQGPTLRFQTSDVHRLNEAFIDYINFGGYPEAVLNSEIQQNIERYLGRDIVDKVLLRDLPSLYGIRDIQELNRLFTVIAYHSGQEISLDGLAKSSGVAKNTIGRYLEYLEAAFLIVRVRRVDDRGRTFQRMRNFKVFLTNPSMRAALFSPLSDGDEAMGTMVETALFSQWFHSNLTNEIHYARWKGPKGWLEVDLVRVNPANLRPTWAYEVKWSDRYPDHPEELQGLMSFAKTHFADQIDEGTVPVGATTKSVTRETEVDGIAIKHFPCALHCYQIGRNVIEGRPA